MQTLEMRRKQRKRKLNRMIALRVDEQTFKWLEKVQDVLFQEDMSSTVRALFRIMQFLIETDQISIPTKEQLDRFADFINEK